MKTSDFDAAFELVIKAEGGYVNDLQDPGGETKFGIADASDGVRDGMTDLNADGVPDLLIKDITLGQSKVIYKREYWDKIKGDQLPYPLNIFVFDSAVNQGVVAAIKLLQKTLAMPQDGLLGPNTMKAAQKATVFVVARYLADRCLRYAGTRNFDKYGRGWFTRVFDMALNMEVKK